MASTPSISDLKAQLRHDVAYLCHRTDRLWAKPIIRTLKDIRKENLSAVFLGGTLRSLMLARLTLGRLGRPRDVDIVVSGANVDSLRSKFHNILSRENRFGGLQLQRDNWTFDVWPIESTWAFRNQFAHNPGFDKLPHTTFFNLEAIAVDVWTEPGFPRKIYSGNDQFFHGLLSKTLEVNLQENPFPALCIVRSFILAYSIKFSIGPKLAHYIVEKSSEVGDAELEEAQRKHYGYIQFDIATMRQWIEYLSRKLSVNTQSSIQLPIQKQMTFWPMKNVTSQINVRIFANTGP